MNNSDGAEDLFSTIDMLNEIQPPLDYSPENKTYNLKPSSTDCWISVSPVEGMTSEGGTIKVHVKRTDEGVSISLYAQGGEDSSYVETWMTFAEARTEVEDE